MGICILLPEKLTIVDVWALGSNEFRYPEARFPLNPTLIKGNLFSHIRIVAHLKGVLMWFYQCRIHFKTSNRQTTGAMTYASAMRLWGSYMGRDIFP